MDRRVADSTRDDAAVTVRPVAVFDTECYRNYWLLRFRALVTGRPLFTFELFDGQSFSPENRERIVQVFELFTVVSFNGNNYDVPMICGALSGRNTQQLKDLNDAIIVRGLKPWELGLPDWKPSDHIDIFEVCPGTGSQKMYAARIHCKTIRDLPVDPAATLTPEEIRDIRDYNVNDLDNLEEIAEALRPQLTQRAGLSARYGVDLRSKSDAQVAESVLRVRCERALGRRVFKPEIDWNMQFKYVAPAFLQFQTPQMQRALMLATSATFGFAANGSVGMPRELDSLTVALGQSVYRLGIGGLHSSESCIAHRSDEQNVLRDADVASYYPRLILNSGEFPPALGPAFRHEYETIINERLADKAEVKRLKKAGDTESDKYHAAKVGDDGGKIMINGTFGKTGSVYSILFAPTMLIQTTLTGQLSLLMLIEWMELNGIPIVSANTDGIVMKCPRDRVALSDAIIAEWQKRTGLEMEVAEYLAIYSRDVNNYFAIKPDGDVKRKGEYARAGLVEKKNPDAEICADAVADLLARGVPIEYTVAACRDIRKFVCVQKVSGGAVKMHGDGPRKGAKVRDMVATLERNGWAKSGRQWQRGTVVAPAGVAFASCFEPQRPEYLGKVARWYYGTNTPGPILYATNDNTVGGSWGAAPCMTLPDEFPDNVDLDWYIARAYGMLADVGALQK